MMIAQDEVMKQAQSKATEIVTQAQTKSKEIRQASQEFSDEVLRKAEESLANSLSEVRGRPARHSRAPSGSLPSRTIPVPSKGKSNTDLFRAGRIDWRPCCADWSFFGPSLSGTSVGLYSFRIFCEKAPRKDGFFSGKWYNGLRHSWFFDA